MSAEEEPKEERRWARLLGLRMVAFAVLLSALFGTGIAWFIVPALIALPIVGSLTIVYLAMSSDTNSRVVQPVEHERSHRVERP